MSAPSRRIEPWDVVYYLTDDEIVPADEFLDGCPTKVSAQFAAVLDDVAEAPPPRYSGGGRWEAMHGSMGGYYEVRAQGPKREQFRLLCILENGTPNDASRPLASDHRSHHRDAEAVDDIVLRARLRGGPPPGR